MTTLRIALAGLLIALAPAAAAQDGAGRFDPGAMTGAEREAFGEAVRSYLLENPEVIMEAIEVLEARRNARSREEDAALIARHAEALFESEDGFVLGNPDGDVTVIEFSDYRCGFCKRAHPILKELIESDPGVRLVVREFPILGPESVMAGRMAMAAHDIDAGLYPALNDALMNHRGELTEAAAYRIAKEVGYDIPALKERAQGEAVEARLQRTYELARGLGLQGTPSFVIGDQILRGFLPIEEMRAAIAEARAEEG
jgi:protein-disulfide isomerase